jgi:hypothetical protein
MSKRNKRSKLKIIDIILSKILIKPLYHLIKNYIFSKCNECKIIKDDSKFKYFDEIYNSNDIIESDICYECYKIDYQKRKKDWTIQKKQEIKENIIPNMLTDIFLREFESDDDQDWYYDKIEEFNITLKQLKEVVKETHNSLFDSENLFDDDE